MLNVKPSQLYVFSALLVILYLCVVLGLYQAGVLKGAPLAETLSQFFGFLIAIVVAALHLTKSRMDADEGRRLETMKGFQIEAYRQVNDSLRRFSKALTQLASPYDSITGTLYTFPSDLGAKRIKEQIYRDMIPSTALIFDGCSDFLSAFEANEVALLKFAHLKNYISHEVQEVHKVIMDFQKNYVGKPVASFFEEDTKSQIAKASHETSHAIGALQAHLSDFRILLMNEFLGDVFGSKTAHRIPRDPRFSLLQDIATPETVEKIDHDWYEKVLSYRPPYEE